MAKVTVVSVGDPRRTKLVDEKLAAALVKSGAFRLLAAAPASKASARKPPGQSKRMVAEGEGDAGARAKGRYDRRDMRVEE